MRTMIRSAKDAYDYVSSFGLQEGKESRMILVYMSHDGSVLGWNERGKNQAQIKVKDIDDATSAVIVTNHPSGNCFPDKYDIQETLAIRELLRAKGLGLIDQIIVGYKEFYSYAEEKITFVK